MNWTFLIFTFTFKFVLESNKGTKEGFFHVKIFFYVLWITWRISWESREEAKALVSASYGSNSDATGLWIRARRSSWFLKGIFLDSLVFNLLFNYAGRIRYYCLVDFKGGPEVALISFFFLCCLLLELVAVIFCRLDCVIY